MSLIKVSKIGQFEVFYRNKEELERIKKEVFVDEEYLFKTGNNNPFIIDCGSHIGLSILYFKKIYPEAEILGFEPNPENFKILQKNIQENKLKNVIVYNAALSGSNGKDFLRTSIEREDPWTWGDTIINNMWGSEENSGKIEVKTVKLSKYIDKPVDLLKIDIEGSEQKVLEEIKNKLHFVKQIKMEFHHTPTNKTTNNYQKTKKLLEENFFEVKAYSKDRKYPFPDLVYEILDLKDETMVFSVEAKRKQIHLA